MFTLWSYIVSDIVNFNNLFRRQFGKMFLILIISLILSLETCAYNWLFEFEATFNNWFLLKYLDLAKTLLLSLGGIGREILDISACLLSVSLRMDVLIGFLLNWEETHCLKDIFLSLTINLFQPDLYIADKNLQAATPNSAIYRISLDILFFKEHCLMNLAILRREHVIFFTSPVKYSSIPNKEIGQKLPSHSCRSISWLTWYGITKGSRLWEANILLVSKCSRPWESITLIVSNVYSTDTESPAGSIGTVSKDVFFRGT